jgi:hypothetical protein
MKRERLIMSEIERFKKMLKQCRSDVQLTILYDKAFLTKDGTSFVLCSIYDLYTFTDKELKKQIGDWFPLNEI